jgi:hypothetical protein
MNMHGKRKVGLRLLGLFESEKFPTTVFVIQTQVWRSYGPIHVRCRVEVFFFLDYIRNSVPAAHVSFIITIPFCQR